MRKGKFFAIVIWGLSVSGCVSAPPSGSAVYGIYPISYKKMIQDHMRQYLLDPYSLRDVSISEPREWHVNWQSGWQVCVRMNAKNGYGAYTGVKSKPYLIKDGEFLMNVSESQYEKACRDAKFEPWPEMEGKS